MTIPPPPGDIEHLSSFPTHVLRPGVPLARIHRVDREPAWFSNDAISRFDPPSSDATFGTCYLSTHPEGAFVEVFGPHPTTISRGDIDARALTQLGVTKETNLADFTHPQVLGRFGLTGEASAGGVDSYPACQRWALALHAAGFGGIRYHARHDPSLDATSVALFGLPGLDDKTLEVLEPTTRFHVEGLADKYGYTIIPSTPLENPPHLG